MNKTKWPGAAEEGETNISSNRNEKEEKLSTQLLMRLLDIHIYLPETNLFDIINFK